MKSYVAIFALLMTISCCKAQVPGSLDNSFGSTGKIIMPFLGYQTGNADIITAMVIQPDGKILVTGISQNSMALLRYLQNGAVDASFGANGRAHIADTAGYAIAQTILLQPDGKIVIAGQGHAISYADFIAIRVDSTGMLDSAFGSNGRAAADIASQDYCVGSALMPDGKIVLCGSAHSSDSAAILRFTSGGIVDTTFNHTGAVTLSFALYSDVAEAVAAQPDGKIVAAIRSTADFMLIRFDSSGRMDSSFGMNGIVSIDMGYAESPCGVIIQPDGKIVVGGTSSGWIGGVAVSDFAIARCLPDGTPDSSFNVNGKSRATISGERFRAESLALAPDGRIVVAGYREYNPNYDFALACFNSDGIPDSNFGANGIVKTSMSNFENRANSVAVQADAKIVLGGWTTDGSYTKQFALSRYHSKKSDKVNERNFPRTNIIAYPNPTKDELHIEMNLEKTEKLKIYLTDVSGRELYATGLKEYDASKTTVTISMKGLSQGTYFYHVADAEGRLYISRKAMKE